MTSTPHDALFKSTFSRPEHAAAVQEILELSPAALAAMAEFVPRFRFVLDDISAETDEALRNRARMTALGRVVLWCLRHARAPWELLERLPVWRQLVQEARQGPGGSAAIRRVWQYILRVTNPAEPEAFLRELLAQAGQEAKLSELGELDPLRPGLRMADDEPLVPAPTSARTYGHPTSIISKSAPFGRIIHQ